MRDHFYKVGSEALGVLIDRHPQILQKILLLIDRNLDALDDVSFLLSPRHLLHCGLLVGCNPDTTL